MPQLLGVEEQPRYRDHVLVREMQHRLKNTLAMVQAIVFQSFRSSGTREQIEKAISARLSALAQAHDMLMLEGGKSVSLRDIVERLITIHDTKASRFRVDGPEISLEPQLGFALTLILHEMATNAVKYGALLNESGHVELTWQVAHPACAGTLRLRWAEVAGPAVALPQHRGFGVRFIEELLAPNVGMTARLTFPQTGVVLTIHAPRAQDTVPSAV